MKNRKPTAIVKTTEPTAVEWKARALAAERRVGEMSEAFGILIAPFAEFMREKIEELVADEVDSAISSLQISRWKQRIRCERFSRRSSKVTDKRTNSPLVTRNRARTGSVTDAEKTEKLCTANSAKENIA